MVACLGRNISREKLVFGRRQKPLHFCLTFIDTFAISGRISAESTFGRFWDQGSRFRVFLGSGFEVSGAPGISAKISLQKEP